MSELADCTNNLTASDILRGIAKTANGVPFYLTTMGLGGDPCAEYSNILINSGGQVDDNLCADDWVDTNTDGIADNWTQATGAGIPAIVTGNGFLGNAQRINHVNGTTTQFHQLTGINTENGATYYFRMRYRTNNANWRIYLRGSVDAIQLGLPANVGDALLYEDTVVATAASEIILRFFGLSGQPSNYLEIDDVVVYKL